jgi:predicted transcriptional regulator
MPRELLLMSIRPQYVKQIFAGTKTVELRRVRPAIEPGDRILIYSSSPVMAIVGTAEVEDLIVARPERLWIDVGKRTGISRAAFRSYFEGTGNAVGIALRAARPLKRQIPLEELRRRWPWLQPPQSFRYIRAKLTDGRRAASVLRITQV